MDAAPLADPGAQDAAGRSEPGRRYLLVLGGMLAGLVGAVIGFCALVDPFFVIGSPCVAGLTCDKPAAAAWPRMAKAYTVLRADPKTLIIGSSSADIGFDPSSAAWPAAARPVFNLGIDGGLPGTGQRYLQHALSATHPAHVVIAVNFVESLVMPARRDPRVADEPSAFETRLRVLADGRPNPGVARAHVADLVFATLSFTAVQGAIETLLHQNDPVSTHETVLGWNDGGDFRRWARQDGFHELIVRKDREKIPQLVRWRDGGQLDIAPVPAMVREARARGAAVTVVILPNHADEMQWVRQLGLGAAYDAWKTAIVTGVTQAAPDGSVPIWDFSGYTDYTTEAVPGPGDRTHRLRWFWEPIHFQAGLGALMIARMSGAAAPADFGVRLTPAALPAQIAAFHAAETAWEKGHAADVARVATIIGGR